MIKAQRCALADFGRAEIRFEMWKKPEARKMFLEAADSQKSAARFVGQFLTFINQELLHKYLTD